jgi:antitoxin component YwqK of YwqJK toxin-antitoxin module
MKWKRVFGLTVLILVTQYAYNQEANTDIVATEVSSIYKSAEVSDPYSFYPPIESILFNPAVYKKQLSRHSIQAIGRNQAGDEHFIVHFRKKQLHGEWKSFYSNEQFCDSGRFDKNLPDGEWKTWYSNGQVKTIRHYNAELYHYIKADLQRNHPKDQRFAITRYAGRNFLQHFQPHYEGDKSISQTSSILRKIQFNTSGNGDGYLPPFTTCLHHGVYINYQEDGVVKDSGSYDNGLKQGLWIESVSSDNIKAFGFYMHGLRNGQWKYYDSDGELFYSAFYKKDGRIKEEHYFKK